MDRLPDGLAAIRARLGQREHDPAVVSDARLAQLPALQAAFTEPSELEDAIPVDTTASVEQAVTQALRALRTTIKSVASPPTSSGIPAHRRP